MRDERKTKKQLIKEMVEYRKKITALKRVKAQSKLLVEALKDSEEKYRSLVDSIDDSIYLIDRQYRYLFMNEKHMTRMGLSGHSEVAGFVWTGPSGF
jgi:PAS domain-containing protein